MEPSLAINRSVMREHYDAIVEFSGLYDFMDTPLKNFSSGMLARLAFSIMTFRTPGIFCAWMKFCLSVILVFKEKCRERDRGAA